MYTIGVRGMEYNTMVQDVRNRLVWLTTKEEESCTTVLIRGSGTFAVEAVIGSVIPRNGKLLVCTNGAYGKRIVQMAEMLHTRCGGRSNRRVGAY